jgi:hypothetical protein
MNRDCPVSSLHQQDWADRHPSGKAGGVLSTSFRYGSPKTSTAAVDAQFGAIDEAALTRGKEDCGTGPFFRRAHASCRDPIIHCLQEGRAQQCAAERSSVPGYRRSTAGIGPGGCGRGAPHSLLRSRRPRPRHVGSGAAIAAPAWLALAVHPCIWPYAAGARSAAHRLVAAEMRELLRA